jgi:16S rRNA (adenine1518-N6/adenine1519-N6)-dimethyltransferase
LLRQDALKSKNQIHPNVLAIVQERLAEMPHGRFKLAANLPYNIATPLVSNLLSAPLIPVSMTVTIQKEVADRLMARPGTKEYGALSVWVQSQCSVELIRELPPSVFWPRPKVSSAIIQVRPEADRRSAIAHPEFFHGFVRRLFLHRRKFLRSGLLGAVKGLLDKPDVDRLFAELELAPDARAEQLSWPQLLQLAEAVYSRTGGPWDNQATRP